VILRHPQKNTVLNTRHPNVDNSIKKLHGKTKDRNKMRIGKSSCFTQAKQSTATTAPPIIAL